MSMDIEALRRDVIAASHGAANTFPLMSDDELHMLAEDIKANGLREPIFRDGNGLIIDGRNRWIACKLAGSYCGEHKFSGTADEIVAFVVSHNLRRRHLDESQRGLIAARIANLPRGNPTGANQHGEGNRLTGPIPPTVAQAAEMLNVGERTVKRGRAVLASGNEETIREVERGEMSLWRAERVVKAAKATSRQGSGKMPSLDPVSV